MSSINIIVPNHKKRVLYKNNMEAYNKNNIFNDFVMSNIAFDKNVVFCVQDTETTIDNNICIDVFSCKFLISHNILLSNDKYAKNMLLSVCCPFYFSKMYEAIEMFVKNITKYATFNFIYCRHNKNNVNNIVDNVFTKNMMWITKLLGIPTKICKHKIICLSNQTIYDMTFEYNNFTLNFSVLIYLTSDNFNVNTVDKKTKMFIINSSDSSLCCNFVDNKIYTNKSNVNIASHFDDNFVKDEIEHFKNITEKEQINMSIHNLVTIRNLFNECNTCNTKFIRLGILINVRLSSTRLKQKHIIEIQNRRIIDWLIMRIKFILSALHIDATIVIASSNANVNKCLTNVAHHNDIEVFYGCDDNIPLRHLQCANFFGFTHIIPIDGDNLYVSELAFKIIYDKIIDNNKDIVRTINFPIGLNLIYYKTNYLREIMKNNKTAIITTGWHRIFDDIFDIDGTHEKYGLLKNIDLSLLRLTVDYPEDVMFFAEVLKYFGNTFVETSTNNLINHVIKNKIYEINITVSEKYWNNFHLLKKQEIDASNNK